jgi:glycosyltransferase involved in cell wall biosynthesis
VLALLSSEHSTTSAVVAMSIYYQDNLMWLKQSINSVLEQTYKDFIFVIVIDGIIKKDVELYVYELKNSYNNIVILSNEKNYGLSYSMNKVITWASEYNFKYFIRMDADDICLPERFDKQISYMESHANVGVLGTSLIEVNEEGKKVGKRLMSESHSVLLKAFSRRCPLNHPTVVIRFSIFSAFLNYDPEHKNTQDYFLWIKMASKGVIFANLRQPLLKFRRVKGFYKRRGRAKSLNEFKARMLAMKLLKQWSIVNFSYACMVFMLRMMPMFIIRLAYTFDRYLLHRKGKQK